MKKEKNIETPVLLIFFNRPDVLKETFEWIKAVKPNQLFLAQDGPRIDRPEDNEKILKCRQIIENGIDWECEVYRNYAEENMSCDDREFSAISWAFEKVDRLIILEDDCKPSYTFYQFCGELLQRYEEDNRVHMISGFNRINDYVGYPYSYMFSLACAGLGWATWKRCWSDAISLSNWEFLNEDFEKAYSYSLDNIYAMKYKNRINTLKKHMILDEKNKKINSWEILFGNACILNNRLCITPVKNMVEYMGIVKDATHSVEDVKLMINRTQKVLTQSAYDIEVPLKHPPFVMRDLLFEKKDYEAFWKSNLFLDYIEAMWKKIKSGRFDLVIESIKKRWS